MISFSKVRKLLLISLVALSFGSIKAEDGYELWLRYIKVDNPTLLTEYRKSITSVFVEGNSPIVNSAKEEVIKGLSGLLDTRINEVKSIQGDGCVVITLTPDKPMIAALGIQDLKKTCGEDGYIIKAINYKGKKIIIITGSTDKSLLYGTFHFLRLIQTQQQIKELSITSTTKIKHRLLNHWDNLNRTVERGYAGFSIWNWHLLPDYISPRYKDYARANASIGINGTVLTNVNANALVLTKPYLEKVATLAEVFRAYGIKVYLTARFSAPIEIGGLKTADPLDTTVRRWWKDKIDEIYSIIPDFGGFLVKANSEGQPGPQNYGRNHGDGANMFAEALAPHGGIVMWRAFVYDNNVPDDRAKQAYNEFKPLDGTFLPNVFVQVKNGAIDFQPREPFHPLFGAMPKTPLMMEFQITQEYLGQATNLVYLAPYYKECFDSDTYSKGVGSTVAKVIDGTLDNHSSTGIAGVSNIGDERNWCGHPFAQSNWYAFGRLSWDPHLSSETIAEEWIRMTFSNNKQFLTPAMHIMLTSRENLVNYMTPIGLHHIMGRSHHYGPGPWVTGGRPDWTSLYYHRADSVGIGFNRSATGSGAVNQYFPVVRDMFNTPATCPEKYLLWFHHLPWDYKMKSGNSLWNEMCSLYNAGVDSVKAMQKTWESMKPFIDNERFEHVKMLINIQQKEAIWWRDACLLYFQTFSKRPFPESMEKPKYPLNYYETLEFRYAPGI
jgi:alpha-glucuronidase